MTLSPTSQTPDIKVADFFQALPALTSSRPHPPHTRINFHEVGHLVNPLEIHPVCRQTLLRLDWFSPSSLRKLIVCTVLMSPHRALQVPEILSTIFDNFYGEDFTDEDSLAALARSCKVFFEPAVSVLWRRLEFLWYLFKVIPSFEFDESRQIYVRPSRFINKLDSNSFKGLPR